MRRSAIAVTLFALALAGAEWLFGMHLAGGAFVYPLDDAYIHLAIARNLAANGTWGLESGVPVFASSSPLWTVLLAVFVKLLGFREWLPFALSYVFAAGSLALAFRLWARAGLSVRASVVAGLLLVLAVPFTTLSNLGMEHALHVFCLEWFLLCLWNALDSERLSRSTLVSLTAAAMCSVGSRYESLFVITPAALLLLGNKRLLSGFSVLAAQFVPVILMGLLSVSLSRPFFPVSLLLKTNVGGTSFIGGIFSLYCGIAPESVHFHVLCLLLLASALLPRTPPVVRGLVFALVIAAGGHGVFARLGWLYRYEAYLLALGFTVLPLAFCGRNGESAAELPSCGRLDFVRRYSWLLLVLALACPFLIRSFKAQADTVLAQREINAQQYQMGRIFATLPGGLKGPVAVSDLGCVALYSGVHVLDLWGLGSPDVAEMILSGDKTPARLSELFTRHGVRYFALYSGWYDLSLLAPHSVVVADLDLTHPNVVCSGQSVWLGVVDPADVQPFRRHLEALLGSMPPGASLKLRGEPEGSVINKERPGK